MQSHIKSLFIGIFIIWVGFLSGTAQTFKTVLSFSSITNGAPPDAGLVLSGDTLYGATFFSLGGNGNIYKVKTNGTSFTALWNFSTSGVGNPETGLILLGNRLYGTTLWTSGKLGGSVFSISTNGGSPTTLHSFSTTSTNADGSGSTAVLILSGNTLYGTTQGGGEYGAGVVFGVTTNGGNFTNLHSFTSTNNVFRTNSDGATPYAGLVLSGNVLYGTARKGGDSGKGTVFALNTNGTGFTTLHNFTGNSDGAEPRGALVSSGNTLYGTASGGGDFGSGTLFKLNNDGTGFTTLYNFTSTNNAASTNSDGASPYAPLILAGNTLYGTTYSGGSSGFGTVFAINTNGTDFTVLHTFSTLITNRNSDGVKPISGLVLSGNALYGTTTGGGRYTGGTIYSISFTPQLGIVLSETNVVLSWPTNVAGFSYAGFTLQSTTNLVATNSWSTVSPAPTVVNGQNTVTNLASSAEKYYRLVQ